MSSEVTGQAKRLFVWVLALAVVAVTVRLVVAGSLA
jgi:hypothetical protein